MTGIETALLLSMGGAAISSLWDTPSKASRKFSVDDEIYGPMRQHIDNLQGQKGMAGALANKEAGDWLAKAGGRIAGIRYDPRDAAAGARGQAQAMGGAAMDAGSMAMRNKMQREMMLERLIGSQESGLLGNQLLDRRHTEQVAAGIPTYGEKFGAAMGQGAQLLGMSGGKGGGGGGYAAPQFAPLPPLGSSLPEWGATPTGAGSYGGLYGGGGDDSGEWRGIHDPRGRY
jgi:hypothetical protein